MGKVENYTQEAIRIANDDRHGYSQYNRDGNPDFDCSSLANHVVNNAGIPVKKYGATYTGNMYRAYIKAGFKDVTNQVNLSTGYGLKRGDILLNHKNHVEIHIGNGKNVGARSSERGTIHGKPGDQTGREIRVDRYYNYPWNCVLRYPEKQSSTNTASSNTSSGNYLREFAKEVINGKYGNGNQRRQAIYMAVQTEVNNILGKKKLKNNYVTAMAKDVLAGKYGNGDDRKDRLYKAVQNEVNKLV